MTMVWMGFLTKKLTIYRIIPCLPIRKVFLLMAPDRPIIWRRSLGLFNKKKNTNGWMIASRCVTISEHHWVAKAKTIRPLRWLLQFIFGFSWSFSSVIKIHSTESLMRFKRDWIIVGGMSVHCVSILINRKVLVNILIYFWICN